jgi:hypothetical protein
VRTWCQAFAFSKCNSCRRYDEVWEKVLSLQTLCKNGLVFQDSASGGAVQAESSLPAA